MEKKDGFCFCGFFLKVRQEELVLDEFTKVEVGDTETPSGMLRISWRIS